MDIQQTGTYPRRTLSRFSCQILITLRMFWSLSGTSNIPSPQALTDPRLRKKEEALCFELNNANFTTAQTDTIIDTRSCSIQKRRLLIDPIFVLVKDIRTPGDATGSAQLQTKLALCIVNQLLPPSATGECVVDRVRFYGDGGTSMFLWLSLFWYG